MKRTQVFALAVVALGLAGCDRPTQQIIDRCMQNEIFERCLARVPPGPQVAHYGDWDEVVDSCNSSARDQSRRLRYQVRPECRSE